MINAIKHNANKVCLRKDTSVKDEIVMKTFKVLEYKLNCRKKKKPFPRGILQNRLATLLRLKECRE